MFEKITTDSAGVGLLMMQDEFEIDQEELYFHIFLGITFSKCNNDFNIFSRFVCGSVEAT